MVARELVSIGTHLRLVAFGIECAHDVGLVHAEIHRALADSQRDSAGSHDSGSKRYVFRSVGGVQVEGVVDEYEPGDMWVVVEGHRNLERDLPRIVASAGLLAEQIDRDGAPSNKA